MDRPYLLEQIDDAAVVQLYADGFPALPPEQKILVWHLSQAALAGRDIYYDQRYRHNLEMRGVLEAILRAANKEPSGFDPVVLAEIRRYTKLFWINTGPYNSLTSRKFVLRCSLDALVAAAEQAQSLGVIADEPGVLRVRIERLGSAFFDASSEPMVTNKTPEPGGDILRDSANNLYSGVSLADLDGFSERYGLNSRLVKTRHGLVEEVAREQPDGLYQDRISSICRHLNAALPFTTPAMRKALEALITFYRSGEDADRVAYDIA